MIFFAEAATDTGLIVTLISGGITAVVLLLIFMAKRLFKAGDIVIVVRRRAFLDTRDVNYEFNFVNADAKNDLYRGFDLYGKTDKGPVLLGKISACPISPEFDTSFMIFEDGKFGIILQRNTHHQLFISYNIPDSVSIQDVRGCYFLLELENGHSLIAEIPDFLSMKRQTLKIKRGR